MAHTPKETFTTNEAVAFLTETPNVLATDMGEASVEASPTDVDTVGDTSSVSATGASSTSAAPLVDALTETSQAAPKAKRSGRKQRKAEHHAAILSAKSLILLALIEGPATCTEIKRNIKERSFGKMEMLSGSLYPGLDTLVAKGYVELLPGYKSKMYALTEEGRQVASEERRALLNFLQTAEERDASAWFHNAHKGFGRNAA